MAEDDAQERKQDATERRVYTLPANLLERLRAYQVSQGITSEAEAARRLLDTALQMRDGVVDILKTLQSRFAEEKDLRVLASEILTKHALVNKIFISDGCVDFELRDGDWGRFGHRGNAYWRSAMDRDDDWTEVKKPLPKQVSTIGSPSLEPTGGDLDDEIPF